MDYVHTHKVGKSLHVGRGVAGGGHGVPVPPNFEGVGDIIFKVPPNFCYSNEAKKQQSTLKINGKRFPAHGARNKNSCLLLQ